MKKILFPFAGKYDLSKFLWHRIAVALYSIFLLFSLGAIFYLLQHNAARDFTGCPYLPEYEPLLECPSFVWHMGLNFVIALAGTVILGYMLQYIYYKVILAVHTERPKK